MRSRAWILRYPISSLLLCFLAWKTLLLLVVASSPAEGYDTSTSLSYIGQTLPNPLHHMIGKLTRWDAIYFVKVARRGYRFEQDWAWGWGFTRMVAFCTTIIVKTGAPHYDDLEGLVAILIAHSAHLLSVFVLHKLTAIIFSGSPMVAFTTAFFHIIAPAGVFLSAPYAESSCSLLTFWGCLLFTKSLRSGKESCLSDDILILGSGLSFAIATTFRTNGILNGLLLLEEAFRTLFLLRHGFRLTTVRHLIATGVGGLTVAGGLLLPQYIAYQEYCRVEVPRPWCDNTLPSIYTFVQHHYWNVGLFRYWTMSNLPLFLLATPILLILIRSSVWALRYSSTKEGKLSNDRLGLKIGSPSYQVLRNLAASQVTLSVITLTTAHVQIITRMASSYPLWLWYLAVLFRNGSVVAKAFVSFMVIYGIVQGGLFASFLPPA